MVVPSADGIEPKTAVADGFFDGLAIERSQTCTLSMRASGTVTVATCFSGMRVP